MKLKTGELNTYWREAKRRQYMKEPAWQARKALIDFKSKKEALTEGEDTTELLEDLIASIRKIFSNDRVEEEKVKLRRAGK